ncbi:MAG: hypothetical protein JNM07_07670 [Phycisphaerae bacterium]|nr:hypothetical protein [Phycisphaerae bacterium]
MTNLRLRRDPESEPSRDTGRALVFPARAWAEVTSSRAKRRLDPAPPARPMRLDTRELDRTLDRLARGLAQLDEDIDALEFPAAPARPGAGDDDRPRAA